MDGMAIRKNRISTASQILCICQPKRKFNGSSSRFRSNPFHHAEKDSPRALDEGKKTPLRKRTRP
jgi:hypothetical protein